MKKFGLNIPTIIAFSLVPVLAVVRSIYAAPSLEYGNDDITLNSVFLLLFGIYCFLVSTWNLIQVQKSWKTANPEWKSKMMGAYIYIILFAIALAFLMAFVTVRYFDSGGLSAGNRFVPEAFLAGLVFVSPAFLFPIGVILLILALCGLKYRRTRPKSYLVATFLISGLFTFGGALPAFFVAAFWMGGGLALCYCPVNRKSFTRNVLLKPLYNYRKNRLRRQLNI